MTGDLFSDIMTMTFFQRAIVAGILVGFLGSFYGVFVVQRRMSFLGNGLAHATFGGVALGLLLQTEPLLIAVPFTLIVAILITFLKDKTKLEIDTSIGIFFALSMALGIVFLSFKKDYSVDAFSYLFGSILMVQRNDIIAVSILTLLTVILSLKYWKRWAYATLDRELARADRLNPRFDDYLLSIMIALTIVLSIKLVGIVLIAAFLVIPAAVARLLTQRFFIMTIYAIIFGILSSLIGLLISIIFNMPTGAVIILVQSLLFIFAVTLSSLRKF